MIEEIKTPQTSEYRAAARRIIGSGDSKVIIAIGAGAALLLGGAVGINTNNSTHSEERNSSIIEQYQQNEAVLQEIKDEALAPVDPANIVGLFDVTPNTTVNDSSIAIVKTLTGYEAADKQTKDFIDFTVLESGKAQGSYDLGDTFTVSRATIDGRDTFIVQDGAGVEEPTIPAPITH